jgi:branched-chain amino acid transport system substrate-binding protein
MIGRGEFLGGLGSATMLAALPVYSQQVTIAAVCPTSGEKQKAGEDLLNGVRAAIDEYNREQRMAMSRAFVLRAFDDKDDVADAIVNAQFTTDDETIVATIGHLTAKPTFAALRTYAQAYMPLIVPTVTADAITQQGYHNIFRLPTRDYDDGKLLANYAIKTASPKVVHALVQDGDYGADVASAFLQTTAANKITSAYTIFRFNQPNYVDAAEKALAAKPDVILLAGSAGDMGPVIQPLRAGGFTGLLLGSQGFFDGRLISSFAHDAEGMIVSSSMPFLAIAPSAYRLLNDYSQQYGQITPVSAFGYAAAQIIIAAVSRSGVTQRNALLTQMALSGSYETIAGNFQFSPVGDPLQPNIYFYTVKGGKFAYVRQAVPSTFLSR